MSLLSRLAFGVLWASRRKRRFTDVEAFRRYVARTRGQRHAPPATLAWRVGVQPGEIGGWPSYTVTPRRGPANGLHVLYLHGGSYVFEMVREQWDLAAALARRLSATVHVPGYPLPPRARAGDILAALPGVYRALLSMVDARDVVVVGDSAGGGMALALVQLARDQGLPQPRDTVLFAPWLDLTLTDPGIAAVAPRDPMLAVPGLREAAAMYAGDWSPDHPLLSPVHADLTGLGRISLFIGTRDILLPDCRRLRDRAADQGVALSYVEYPGMFHDWMAAVPLPEARRVFDQVAGIVKAVSGPGPA